MEKNINGIEMPLSVLKNYISEWFLGISTKIEPGKYDSYDRRYSIIESGEGLVVFVKDFKVNELISEDSIVSTAGIPNEELRGLVEQCYRLDKQCEEYRKRDEQEAAAKQKQ